MSRIGPREPSPVSLRPRRSLTDLLWLANTRHGPGGHWFARVTVDRADHDHLATGPNATRYLVDHHVDLPAEAPTGANLRDLQVIRDMVRGLVEPGASWTPAARAMLARTRFGLGLDGDIAAEGSGWSGFIGDLMIPLIQVVELRDRLRLCGNPHCRLMFLDLSKNRARQWCDNGGCGNRDRVRRYRSRARLAADPAPA
ncbi:MAG: CGNR zinc finger domain-containing protein [Candidatus Limnocylindrales bacterium]